jgi:hypothetical protein
MADRIACYFHSPLPIPKIMALFFPLMDEKKRQFSVQTKVGSKMEFYAWRFG